jgi:hypothetical protein
MLSLFIMMINTQNDKLPCHLFIVKINFDKKERAWKINYSLGESRPLLKSGQIWPAGPVPRLAT